jgi:toxin ParE1/3/4
MKVVITAAAKADLAEIGDFIKMDNPDRAITFISELLDRCRSLGDMPRAYPLVPRYERFGVRRRVYRNYLIFYRINENQIEVLHVLDGARDYESLLFPDS